MNKEYLLNESKTFCMFPWIHIMVTPQGDVFPCCVSANQPSYHKLTKDSSFADIINNESFKTLRKDMLSGTKNKTCTDCYKFEEFSWSWRKNGNEQFGKYADEVLENTHPDGYLDNFKMKYYDVRFRNICNFKCRTCGPDYSTAWQDEENKRITIEHRTTPYNLSKETSILSELLSHIDDVDTVYFAGGEPMITDEHYLILEELIRKNKTDINIRYNTNCSVLKYKQKDVRELWKHFKKVCVSASIDHIGDRAEYIRSGTDWAVVESNLKTLKSLENVDLSINTVLSVFNYTTLDLLYEYLITNNLYNSTDWGHTLINTNSPEYFTSTILPKQYKDIGASRIQQLILRMKTLNFTSQLNMLESAINFTNSIDSWESQRESFIEMVTRKDLARNESFTKTFPELASMMDTI